MSAKYKWDEKLYDNLSSVCVSLTNCLVDLNPLRQTDGEWYTRYRNRLIGIGNEKKRKRAEVQANFRERRRRRLSIGYRQHRGILGDDEETQAP